MPWKDKEKAKEWTKNYLRKRRKKRKELGLCIDCGEPSNGHYRCPKCAKKHSKRGTEYNRRRSLVTKDGKRIYLKHDKRPYPNDSKCELCGKKCKFLAYHHWDDETPWIGLWVCQSPCHAICEAVDSGIIFHITSRYKIFKRYTYIPDGDKVHAPNKLEYQRKLET